MSNRGLGDDPLEMLRAADPIDPSDLPRDTSGPHARALFQEVTKMDTMETRTSEVRKAPRQRMRLALSGAAAAAVIVGAIAVLGGDPSGEGVVIGGDPIAGAAMCVESYDLTTLANRDFAFDGRLTSASGDEVTFAVDNWFAGGSGASVTLAAEGLAPGTITSAGASLELDQRYLVSGSGGNVWACGFTMTYDTAIAADWAAVFSG